jgi:hypothetical protein
LQSASRARQIRMVEQRVEIDRSAASAPGRRRARALDSEVRGTIPTERSSFALRTSPARAESTPVPSSHRLAELVTPKWRSLGRAAWPSSSASSRRPFSSLLTTPSVPSRPPRARALDSKVRGTICTNARFLTLVRGRLLTASGRGRPHSPGGEGSGAPSGQPPAPDARNAVLTQLVIRCNDKTRESLPVRSVA